MKILVSSQRAVKLALVLFLTELVVCQEKWSFGDGELDKSKLEELDGWSEKRTEADSEGLSNDECLYESNGDKESRTSKKEFNTLKIRTYDKFDEKYAANSNNLDKKGTTFHKRHLIGSNLEEKTTDNLSYCIPNTPFNQMNNSIDLPTDVYTKEYEIEPDYNSDSTIKNKRRVENQLKTTKIEDHTELVAVLSNFSEKVRRGIKKPKVKVRTNLINNFIRGKNKSGISSINNSTEANEIKISTNIVIINKTDNINTSNPNLIIDLVDEGKIRINYINDSSSGNQMRIAIIDNANDTSTSTVNNPTETIQQLSTTTNANIQQVDKPDDGIDKAYIKRDKDVNHPTSTSKKVPSTEDIGAAWDKYVLGVNGTEQLEGVDDRIIGGKLIPVNQVPYLIGILRYHRHICGGTLITPHHVLTAAHCVTIKGLKAKKNVKYIVLRPNNYSIRYGSNFSEIGGRIIPAGRFYVHPEYLSRNEFHIYMDLAIIWLPIKADQSVAKIAELPQREPMGGTYKKMVKNRMECVVAGWGKTKSPTREKRSSLVGTRLQLLDTKECSKMFSEHGFGIADKAHICTYSDNTDACQGDSGGGLYCNNKVWGVTSWGIGCAEKNIPGVFARVDTNLEFITSVIYIDEPSFMRSSNSLPSEKRRDNFISFYLIIFLYLVINKLL